MDGSRQTVTKYLSEEKKHAPINSGRLKKFDQVNNCLYEVELDKTQVVIFRFFTPQYEKFQMLELYYKFCAVNNFEESDWTPIHCILALPRWNWKTVYDLKWKQSGRNCGDKIVTIVLLLIQSKIFSHECAVTSTRNMTSGSLVFSKRHSGVQKCCVFVVKLSAATSKSPASWSSAMKAPVNENYSRAVMVLWKSFANFLMRERKLHLQTSFHRKDDKLAFFNKLNKDFRIFIQRE